MRPAELSPELRDAVEDAVERARAQVDADGEARPSGGTFESSLPVSVRDALNQILRVGTYDRAVQALIAVDPELA